MSFFNKKKEPTFDEYLREAYQTYFMPGVNMADRTRTATLLGLAVLAHLEQGGAIHTTEPMKEPFPGKRELLGTVYTEGHGAVKVYMPMVTDIKGIDQGDPEFTQKVVARSVGISYHDFQYWSVTDYTPITNLLFAALKTLGGVKEKT